MTSAPERRARNIALLILAACIIAPPAGWLTYERTLGLRFAKQDYAAALAEWKAAGLPVKADFIAANRAAAVPDAENLLKQPPFEGLSLVQDGRKRATSRWSGVTFIPFSDPKSPTPFDPTYILAYKNRPAVLPAPVAGTPAEIAIIDALEKSYPDLKDLDAVESRYPRAAPPGLDPDRLLFDQPYTAFGIMQSNAIGLTLYSSCKILTGDGAPAIATLRALSRKHTAGRFSPTLVNTMMDGVVTKLAVPCLVQVGLARGVWSDAQLQTVETALRAYNFSETLAHDTVPIETEAGIECFLAIAEDDPACRALLVKWGLPAATGLPQVFGRSTLYRAAAHHRRNIAALRAALGESPVRDIPRIVAALDTITLAPSSALTAGLKDSVPVYAKIAANCATTDMRIASARIAVALERHRRTHGAYPEKLASLVPDLLPAVPVNPWKGHTLDYAVTPGGYTLTWPKSDYGMTGLGQAQIEAEHPGPWQIFGEDIALPESITCFDTQTVVRPTPHPTDIRWEMTPPPTTAP